MARVTLGDWQATPYTRSLIDMILETGRISYGPISKEFEHQFSKLHNCSYGILSNSGTSSLQVALQALKEIHGWADGDEVIVPAVTFVATPNIVLHNRMKLVFVDIEPDYYGIDPERIEAAITPKTRCIIPVHLFGQPADMDPIAEIIIRHRLLTIEDSCETMFVRQSKAIKDIPRIVCFSLYMAHLITAGVGGIAITDRRSYAKKMRSLVNHGRDTIYTSIDDDDNGLTSEIIASRFRFESVGHSSRITEFEAALALAQLEDWQEMIKKRQVNAKTLTRGLSQFSDRLQLPKVRPTNSHAWMMYPLVVRSGDKWPLILHLEENDIETREMLPLTNQPIYEGWCNEGDYPIAKWVNQGGFYIGCHQYLSGDDMEYTISIFEAYYGSKS